MVTDVYDPGYDLGGLPDEQRQEFAQHKITSALSVAAAIVLHFFTLGLFTLIYYGFKHSELPVIKHDDFGAGRAIGFSFIPFFNLYWQFVFWLRLVGRLNFQLRLRGLEPLISRGLMLATLVLGLVPVVNLVCLVMFPLCIGQIQMACNSLVEAQPR